MQLLAWSVVCDSHAVRLGGPGDLGWVDETLSSSLLNIVLEGLEALRLELVGDLTHDAPQPLQRQSNCS